MLEFRNDGPEVMKEEGNVKVGKIKANKDMTRKHGRVNDWGVNGLSALLSSDDLMKTIGQRVSDYWARDMQRIL